MEKRAQREAIDHENRPEPEIEEIVGSRAEERSLDQGRNQNPEPAKNQPYDRPDGILLVASQLSRPPRRMVLPI